MIDLDKNTKDFILEHESEDVRKLALQSKRYPNIDIPFAIQQIVGRQIAKNKIPNWYQHIDIIYPLHLSMEQCSSQQTAIYKTLLCDENHDLLIDLTGGLGVDFAFMASQFKKAIYVETQPQLTQLAIHNFAILNLQHVEVIQSDAVSFLESFKEKADIILIDPARRNEVGRKTVLIEDCTPNLIELDEILNLKAKKTIIKLSPMLDITLASQSLSNITDIHIISINNECKELLLIKSNLSKEPDIHCINLLPNNKRESFIFTKEQEDATSIIYTDTLGKYLYEPNSSIMKAGAYKSIATTFKLEKLQVNSHLYSSDSLITNFPGRVFEIKDVFTANKKEIKEHLKDISQANITTRNYPFSVAEIRKQTKLRDGGQSYIFATTLSNEKKVLILCHKIEH
jgi:predicted RNA methylase